VGVAHLVLLMASSPLGLEMLSCVCSLQRQEKTVLSPMDEDLAWLAVAFGFLNLVLAALVRRVGC